MKMSFQHNFYALAFIVLLVVILVVAKSVLISLGLALLISFILFPEHKKLMQWGMGSILAAIVSILTVVVVLGGILTFFSAEIISLSDEISKFGDKLSKLFADVVYYLNRNISFIEDLKQDELIDDAKTWLQESAGGIVGQTFSGSAAFLTGLITTIIYTFLLLIYHKGLVKAFMRFAPEGKEGQFFNMLKGIQRVGQKYLSGMMILILILGVANSVGLWIIGIDSPFLFGFLAALLSIIPYIGTTLGATIPVLYAFMSTDELWKPIAVAIMFWFIQLVESNFLSPKIVGNSVNVNALAAILSLIVGAAVWGVAGMVLFLPFAAMLKVICENYDKLQPLALMIGEENFRDGDKNKNSLSLIERITKKFKKQK
jgi:predicted PurR-regulated permease PerM